MRRKRFNFSRRIGMHPGVILEDNGPDLPPSEISMYRYSAEIEEEEKHVSRKELKELRKEGHVLWLNITGVHDGPLLKKVAKSFAIHPIAAEDLQNTPQRAKAEEYTRQLLIILHMLTWDEADNLVKTEQVGLIQGEDYVLSFQERPGDVFDSVRRRLEKKLGRIRDMNSDYLAYTLVDAVVDNYFVVLESLQNQFEELEEEVLYHDGPDPSNQVHQLTRELLTLRRAVWPLREAVSAIVRGQIQSVSEEVQIFYRDIHDHIVQIMDWVELMKESLKGLLDSYQAKVSNSTNAVMRVLTIVATIFIPLTFIAGIYGMNFSNMPELAWPFGYPLALLAMGAVAGGMLLYFKRKKWL